MAVLLISARGIQPYSVNYQDCSKPTSVSEVNLHEACSKQDEEPIVPKKYTILQKRQHEKAQGHSCKVKRSTFTVYCGAYSHNKLVQAPSIEVPEDISSHECSSMVNHKRYISHYGTTHVVDIGETIFTASERGVIKAEEGNIYCEGEEMKINNEIIEGVLILSQYRITITEEDYIIDNNKVEVVSDHIILPEECTPEKGQCELPGSVFLWKYERKCPYVKIKEIQLQNENGLLVDHGNKLIFTKEDRARMGAPCPVGNLYYTEYSDLYLSEESEFDFVRELSMSLYVKTRSNYANYIMEQRTKENDILTKTSECKTRMNRVGDEIRPMSGDYFSKRIGEVLLIFQCQPKTAKVAEDQNQCYRHLPVYIENKLHFVNSETGILVKDGTKIPCTEELFAPAYKTNEGKWITVNPQVKLRTTPKNSTMIDYTKEVHEDLSVGGLYSDAEFADWEGMVYWSSFKEAAVEHLSQGVCRGSNCHSAGRFDDRVPTYNLDLLKEKADLELSLWNKLNEFIKENFIIVAILIILKFVLTTLLTISLMIYSWTMEGLRGMLNFAYQAYLPEVYRLQKNNNKRKRTQERERSVRYNRNDYENVSIENPAQCATCPKNDELYPNSQLTSTQNLST